jgi:hypothetical protein
MYPLKQKDTTGAGPDAADSEDFRGQDSATFDDEEQVPLSFAPPSSMLFIPRIAHAADLSAHGASPVDGSALNQGTGADATPAILETIADLRAAAEVAGSSDERSRHLAYAKGLEDVLNLPPPRRYIDQPQIAQELTTYLARYKALPKLSEHESEHREIVRKASIIAIHLALRLGYWRNNPKVAPKVAELLTAESVYGSALDVAMTRKPAEFDRLLETSAQAMNEIKARAGVESESMLKLRNPTLWPWVKHNVLNVTHYRRWCSPDLLDTVADAKVFLVLFNVLIDDIADNLQDLELLDVLTQIPRASGVFGVASSDDYNTLRTHLVRIGRSHFVPYFDVTVESWTRGLNVIAEVTGDAYFDLHDQLALDYDRIMQSMRFSVDLNNRPDEVFHMKPEALEREYGAAQFADILCQAMNRTAFYTMDLMCFQQVRPDRYAKLSRKGALAAHRQVAALFQDMHQLGNALATRARETSADDLSNGLFRLANETLNQRDDWELPEHLAKAPGVTRRDALLSAFMLKRAARRAHNRCDPGSPEYILAKTEDLAYSNDLEEIINISGAEEAYFQRWVDRRSKVTDLLARYSDLLEREELLRSNDLLLVLHLMYKGRI